MPTRTPSHFLVDTRGSHTEIDRVLVRQHLDEAEFFWLDLHGPTAEDLSMLPDLFHFHPLAVEDAEHFGQRPKLEEFDEFVYLVAFGADIDRDELVEVHCFLSRRYLVTVHHDDCPPFEQLRQRAAGERVPGTQGALILYAVLDALVDSYFPELAKLDDRIDQIESGVLEDPDAGQVQEIFRLKRRLVSWRKIVTPERDLFARLVTGVVPVPGMTSETERYYRDVYDHLIRISDLIDSYRDLLTSAMDVYLSTVSNRLNDVMKRLTIVATIFMPLTWITGFFGMNFGKLVLGMTGWVAFLSFGVVLQIVTVGVMVILFRRRGWM
jgi:magnesium transporter